jgi:hypothetical protein
MTDFMSFLSNDPYGPLKVVLAFMMLIGSMGFLPERLVSRVVDPKNRRP